MQSCSFASATVSTVKDTGGEESGYLGLALSTVKDTRGGGYQGGLSGEQRAELFLGLRDRLRWEGEEGYR